MEKIKGDGQASSQPITVQEVDTGLVEAPENSENAEDFQHNLTNGKFLKRYFP